MGYYRWNKKHDWPKQHDIVKQQLTELASLNQKLGITGLYQNHAGNGYYGAMVFEMISILSYISNQHIKLALDLRHLRAEAGLSWPTLVRNAANRVGCLYIKDARWKGPQTNQLENVPLGSGFVDRAMFAAVRKQCPSVPISLHVEYHGGKPLEGAALQQAIESYRRDIKQLRQWIGSNIATRYPELIQKETNETSQPSNLDQVVRRYLLWFLARNRYIGCCSISQ